MRQNLEWNTQLVCTNILLFNLKNFHKVFFNVFTFIYSFRNTPVVSELPASQPEAT